jgi:hypothetical protein
VRHVHPYRQLTPVDSLTDLNRRPCVAGVLSLADLYTSLVWCLGPDEVAEHLHVDERTVRARLRSMTDAEKDYIDARMASREESA